MKPNHINIFFLFSQHTFLIPCCNRNTSSRKSTLKTGPNSTGPLDELYTTFGLLTA